MYFSKDLVFVLAACAGAAAISKTHEKYAIFVLVVSILLILLPSTINLANTPLVGAILSFRAYVILPICALYAAGTIRSIRDIDRIIIAVGCLTILVGSLGAVQFQLPQGHFLNRYDWGLRSNSAVFTFGHVRATGTFSYISGMGVMCAVGCWAGTYLFLSGSAMWRRSFAVCVMVFGIVCGLVAMSRSGFLMGVLTILGGVFFFRSAKEALYIAILASLSFWILSAESAEESDDPGITGAIMQRFERADTFQERLQYSLMNLRLGLAGHPFGEGLGTGQVGGTFASSGQERAGAYESELGRIAFEVGVIGLLGVLLIRLAAVHAIWRQLRTQSDRRLIALCAVSLPVVSLLCLNNVAFNHTASSFAWVILAIILGCIPAERRVQSQRSQRFSPINAGSYAKAN
jgi:hypothetical protein